MRLHYRGTVIRCGLTKTWRIALLIIGCVTVSWVSECSRKWPLSLFAIYTPRQSCLLIANCHWLASCGCLSWRRLRRRCPPAKGFQAIKLQPHLNMWLTSVGSVDVIGRRLTNLQLGFGVSSRGWWCHLSHLFELWKPSILVASPF